ncbi:MAG TPA: ABC-F family ATP-binding cassette domain-containing protein [Longimicrobiaceae bacterium]
MTLVRFSGVGKQFGDRWVLRGVDFQVAAGDRWGIVGRNGVGKTTLFRLLTGADDATEGEIWRHPGIRFTLLRQNRGESSAATVREAALEPFAELLAMEGRIEAMAAELGRVDTALPEGARLLHDYDRDVEEFRRRGGYDAHARAQAALEGLGFPQDTWEKEVRRLSGGELGRLRLAQTLLAEPDVLLLDEPTNHLDLRSTEWLESFLRGYAGTVMVVSHDRVFLERLADHVLHLEEGTAYAYTGGYESFLVQREERRAVQLKQWERQQAHVARTEEFIRRNLAGQKTRQAKSRRTLLSRMERVDRPDDEGRAMALRFGEGGRSGGTVLKLDGVTASYGERRLFAPFSAEVSRDERVAMVGANGSGKSTLMRALAGETRPTGGSVLLGAGVRPAYYRQDFTHLRPERRIWEEVLEASPSLAMGELRDHLARFLFRKDEIDARVGDLSGGEQARVALAKITLQRVNLLLMDEPTNHLDIESREVLEDALENFEGTVVLISHDRALLSNVATRIWSLEGGRIADFAGGFDEWQERQREAPAAVAAAPSRPAAAPASGSAAKAGASASSAAGGLSKNEMQRRRQRMEQVEARIHAVEARIAEIEGALADPALYAAGADPKRAQSLAAERDVAQAEVAALYEEWERVGEELAGV